MKQYTISDGRGLSAVILPEKGATVKQLSLSGEDFLYVDEDNLNSDERPRCGIPFIFPNFGRLENSTYMLGGKSYHMEIHGIAHTSRWTVEEHTPDTLHLSLSADAQSLAAYPFAFRAELIYSIRNSALVIEQRFSNLGITPMPYTYGFHPYFKVEELRNATVKAEAEYQIDVATGKMVPFDRGEITVSVPEGAAEATDAMTGIKSPVVLNVAAEGRQLMLEFDESFDKLLLWTRADFPFLCVEPISKAGRMRPEAMHSLMPGEQNAATFVITPSLC